MINIDEEMKIILKGVDEVIDTESLKQKLKKLSIKHLNYVICF